MTISKQTLGKRPKVLLIGDINTHTLDFAKFAEECDFAFYEMSTREDFEHVISTVYTDIDAIWCMYHGFGPIGGLPASLVKKLPSTLKLLVLSAVGYDIYDVKALAARGVVVCNSPGLAAAPVADHVLYLTLALFRFSPVFEHVLRKVKNSNDCRTALDTGFKWDLELGRPKQYYGPVKSKQMEPAKSDDDDKDDEENIQKRASTPQRADDEELASTADSGRVVYSFGDRIGDRWVRQPRTHSVGIAGFGAIGKEIGARLASIGMKVHYTKRTPLTPEEEAGLGYEARYHESLVQMLPFSDVLVLALPLNEDTKHIMNDKTFPLLPPDARVINIGRGPLIDTQALLRALKSGKLWGAALDVFEHEPIVEPELCSRWDVILTPHTASSTYENVLAAEKICMNNIHELFYGDPSKMTIVNKQYLDEYKQQAQQAQE